MATSLHFKTSARNLTAALERAGIVLDVYAILNLTDHMITAGLDFKEPPSLNTQHEWLVTMALNSHECIVNAGSKKILAIKALRAMVLDTHNLPTETNGWLKPCKEAIEDDRVQAAAALYSNPWNNFSEHGDGEPPF